METIFLKYVYNISQSVTRMRSLTCALYIIAMSDASHVDSDVVFEAVHEDNAPGTCYNRQPRPGKVNLINKGMLGSLSTGGKSQRNKNRNHDSKSGPRTAPVGISTSEAQTVRPSGDSTSESGDGSPYFLPSLANNQHAVTFLDPQLSGKGREQSLAHAEESRRLLRFKNAHDLVKKMNVLKREDVILGLSSEPARQPSGRTEDYSSSSGSQTSDVQVCPEIKRTEPGDGNEKRRRLPHVYKFPTAVDFIAPGRPNRTDNLGVNWRVRGDQSVRPTGRLCSSLYPVAEALRRERTAPEIVRGRTLGKGDWKVAIVWPRKLNGITSDKIPMQMAREDIASRRIMLTR